MRDSGTRRGLALALAALAALLALGATALGVAPWSRTASVGPAGPPPAGSPPPAEEASLRGRVPEEAVADSAPGEPVDLDAVDRDLDVHGVVVDPDSNPVAGAQVLAVRRPWRDHDVVDMRGWDEVVRGPMTKTAADGTFRLRLRRGEQVELAVLAIGFPRRARRSVLAGERVRIVLAPGASLLVAVKDESDRAVAGARVRARPASRSEWSFDESATTDDGGSVRFGLPAGSTVLVQVDHPDGPSARAQRIGLPLRGEHRVEVLMPAGRTLSGHVLDAATGKGIAGARVGPSWTLDPSVETGATGAFVLEGWVSGSDDAVEALADGYGRARVRVAGRTTVDVRLERGNSVMGRVVDRAGVPVGGAHVWSVGYRSSTEPFVFCTRADRSAPDGRFLLAGLRRDLPHTLVVNADGFGRRLLDFDPHAEPAGTVDLGDVALSPERRIEGRVEDASGSPIPGVVVTLTGWNADRALRRSPPEPAQTAYGSRKTCATDDLGRFRFAGVSAGEHSVSAEPAGVGGTLGREVTVGEADVLDLVLRAATGTFAVEVVDDSGRPLAGAVAFVSTGSDSLEGRTDTRGTAWFSPEHPARRAGAGIHGAHDGRRYLNPAWVDVEPGARTVRLVAVEAAAASGRVVDEAGAPVGGAGILVLEGERRVETRYADRSGAFEVLVPLGTSVDLVLTGDVHDGVLRSADVEGALRDVEPGATGLRLVARPPAKARLRVRVSGPDGATVEGAQVWAQAGARVDAAREEGGGLYAFEALAKRPTEVWAVPPPALAARYAVARSSGVVPDGQEAALAFREGVRVTGTVLDPDGRPAQAVAVYARAGDRIAATGTTDEAGRFVLVLEPDAEGPVEVEAYRSAAKPPQAALATDVRPGAADVVLRLSPAR